jgi:CheY-like chemotaxis protein
MTVKDTGIGIEPRTIPALFEMFSQVDSAIDRAEGGLGIGLALVKGLIGLHGGSVEGESAGMGQGSAFTIRLPRSIVVEHDPVAEPVQPIESVRPSVPVKILVADDNRDAADSMALILEFSGYQVLIAHSGLDALEKARASMPDAMILDIGMPDMNGYEVARSIRAEAWGERIFMLAITGWGQEEDKERALAAGFDQHMTKPVDADAVEQRLRAFVDSRYRN